MLQWSSEGVYVWRWEDIELVDSIVERAWSSGSQLIPVKCRWRGRLESPTNSNCVHPADHPKLVAVVLISRTVAPRSRLLLEAPARPPACWADGCPWAPRSSSPPRLPSTCSPSCNHIANLGPQSPADFPLANVVSPAQWSRLIYYPKSPVLKSKVSAPETDSVISAPICHIY